MDPNQQEQMMQQLAQSVQGMVDQGMQPDQIASQLLQQLPPEQVMEVFVQLGLPEDQAQSAIQTAMQGQGAESAPQGTPPEMTPGSPEQMAYGGQMKKLMCRSFGGNTAPPNVSSEDFAGDRMAYFVNSIKKNTLMAALNDSNPLGASMLPKAELGLDVALKDLSVTKDQYNNDAAIKAKVDAYLQQINPNGVTPPVTNTPSYDANTTYKWDPAQNKMVPVTQSWNYQPGNQGVYPVSYNPFGYSAPGVAPVFRIFGNSGMGQGPRIKGNNLPTGLDAYAFMQQAFSQGPAGKVNDLDYRITGVEDIKGGLFGRKKVGTRYHIDWGAGTQPGSNPNHLRDLLDLDAANQEVENERIRLQNQITMQTPVQLNMDGNPEPTFTPNLPSSTSVGLQPVNFPKSDVMFDPVIPFAAGEEPNVYQPNAGLTPEQIAQKKAQRMLPSKQSTGPQVYQSGGKSYVNVNGEPIEVAPNDPFMNQIQFLQSRGVIPFKALGGESDPLNYRPDGSMIDVRDPRKVNINWDAVGDTYMNTGARWTNFMDKVRGYDAERNNALYSTMNRQPKTFDQMDQGLYAPDGQFIPNQMGSPVLNFTDTYVSPNPQVFEMGGQYDLSDDELSELEKAGFKFKRM